jgi:hypothetical protein
MMAAFAAVQKNELAGAPGGNAAGRPVLAGGNWWGDNACPLL